MSDIPSPYMTVAKEEFHHLCDVILNLREKIQRARELLEKQDPVAALEILKEEKE